MLQNTTLDPQLEKVINDATSNHWDIEVSSEGWVADTSASFAGMTSAYKNEVQGVTGMTEATDITGITFIDGDLASAQLWTWLKPGAEMVTLYSKTSQPTANFTLRLTEVK